jgi:hypothetical protein
MTRKFVAPKWLAGRCARPASGRFSVEPPLCAVLDDPIVQAVMRSDGVSLAALQSAIAETRRQLRQIPPSAPTRASAQEKVT